jgi:hypothetical protein
MCNGPCWYEGQAKSASYQQEIRSAKHKIGLKAMKMKNDCIKLNSTPKPVGSLAKSLASYQQRRGIIAPENASAGSIDLSNNWEQYYQYGINEATEKRYEQDGVAPQTAVGNINGRRVFTPATYSNGRIIPKGYVESHSISNFYWILDGTILPGLTNGYVTPKP